ncbi:hypothetical protein A8B75_01820 [Sphingomonadales bacterium EhC05]|nr:hypothetical protein A8B75_01820 [Sphingomonadales bacterium EhC05]
MAAHDDKTHISIFVIRLSQTVETANQSLNLNRFSVRKLAMIFGQSDCLQTHNQKRSKAECLSRLPCPLQFTNGTKSQNAILWVAII